MNINIPSNYKAYSKVELCSNTLEDVKYFFGIGNNPPIIIGKGENNPICWLYMKNNDSWNEIISANKSNHPSLQVFAHEKKLLIQLNDTIILDSYETNQNTLVIQKLDLRPIGLNIEGDTNSLNIGGNTISQNSISGGKFFIGLG